MKKKEFKSAEKHLVIGGYVLLVLIMLMGLFAIYRNLVDFSESRIRSEDRQELLVVSNVINLLYEAESANDLLTFESANKYIATFDSIRPIVGLRIDTLKQLTSDTLRIAQLDTIEVLLARKLDNLEEVVELMDSLRRAPSVISEKSNTFIPRKSNVSDYLQKENNNNTELSNADTTVIKREKKGFFKRLGDAITGKQDSTVIVEKRQSSVGQKDYNVVVDTIVNLVRQTERLNLEKQRKFQTELADRQTTMNTTNQVLTVRVDGLLKQIEKEEREKVLTLVEAKESILDKSYRTVFWVSIIAVAIAVVFGALFVIDINRSKKYKQKLEDSNARINKLLQSREKLMLSISHDIKAPMSSVLGYIELMESKMNAESHDTYLANMKQSSDHVLQLVSNLLDFQRLESQTWRKNEMNISLKDLIDYTVESFKPLANKKALNYIVINNINNEEIVFGDPFIIREIYSNVISNAIKYTVEGEVSINIDYDKSINKLTLSVKDTGVGIGKEDRERVFEEFERLSAENLNQFSHGTGLGLPITKGLVDFLGGEISFISEKGVGTEFTITLPLQKKKESVIANDMVIDYNKKRFEELSILLVDDDSIQQIMVTEMLKTQGAKVVSETKPSLALEILKKQNFDIIFLDIQIPEMNGFTLIKHILELERAKGKSTPIVALTATSEMDVNDYLEAGFSDLLNKPFTSTDLFDIVLKNAKNVSISRNDELSSSDGVKALVSYVEDDKDSSIAILNAFVEESKQLNTHLQSPNNVLDEGVTSNIAHKMLPLFKMINDKEVVEYLLALEKKKKLTDEALNHIIQKVKGYIEQANNLISDMSKE